MESTIANRERTEKVGSDLSVFCATFVDNILKFNDEDY
jgi:DNA-binding ferritin-like protein (Dps family)